MQGCVNPDYYQTAHYDFSYPEELVALYPLQDRAQSRLLIVDRKTQSFTGAHITDMPALLNPGDQVVFNDTKVLPSRLNGFRTTGGATELLLHTPAQDSTWWAITQPAKKLKLGTQVHIAPDVIAEVVEIGERGERRIRFLSGMSTLDILNTYGKMPLPQYITREAQNSDNERYQTVYAANPGSAAAPTAGLHFTHDLLAQMDERKASRIHVTLNVGLGTFLPVNVEDIRTHPMHREECSIDPHTANKLNNKPAGAKRYCVGTTSVRTLESMSDAQGTIQPGTLTTQIFIYPGYQFKSVDALLTNFHQPRSTLLMLVSAFAGNELIKEAYAFAISKKFRLFSYGDAMLIL